MRLINICTNLKKKKQISTKILQKYNEQYMYQELEGVMN